MTKAFLGGTCNGSMWRDELIPMLNCEYYNPVVKDWTPECKAEELRQREVCDFVVYVITPEMVGVYSIAEAVDDSNKRPERTIFCVLSEYDGTRFQNQQLHSLDAVLELLRRNRVYGTCTHLGQVARMLNEAE